MHAVEKILAGVCDLGFPPIFGEPDPFLSGSGRPGERGIGEEAF